MSEQYFTAEPAAPHREGSVHVLLADVHLELATDSGVFSPRRLDPGTRLLLDTAPRPPLTGNLLDLGSGYGPLALVLAARSPEATVWAVDVNQRALALTLANAGRAGLSNLRCAAPDDPGLPPFFDVIWSNPPIRIGKDALHRLLAGWLGRLSPVPLPIWWCRRTWGLIRCSTGCASPGGWPSEPRPGPDTGS